METQKTPETCACGQYHAPWWGRYVLAPTCKLRRWRFRTEYFDRLMTESGRKDGE